MACFVEYQKENHIGVITLNNPPLNLGCTQVTRAFYDILDDVEKDEELRVCVLAAKGRVYSAGSDMKEMVEHLQSGTYVDLKMTNEIRLRNRIANLPVPTIAAMDGPAYGGGFDMALSCDMRVVAPHVIVSLPEIALGSFPGSGSSYRITRLIGRGRAIEYMLFGKEINAGEGKELGIFNAVAEQETALEFAIKWAKDLAKKSPAALRAVKGSLVEMYAPHQAWLDSVQMKWSRKVAESGHLQMGCTAFFAKKPLEFE